MERRIEYEAPDKATIRQYAGAVARRLADKKLFLMRRVHPQPTEAKLSDLTNFVRGLGIECESLQDRFELKRVVEESEEMQQQHAIHYAVLRSMQKAIYSPEEIGHYAFNSDNYCHFTSPIRRYPDFMEFFLPIVFGVFVIVMQLLFQAIPLKRL